MYFGSALMVTGINTEEVPASIGASNGEVAAVAAWRNNVYFSYA
jgi:hypothetical protein